MTVTRKRGERFVVTRQTWEKPQLSYDGNVNRPVEIDHVGRPREADQRLCGQGVSANRTLRSVVEALQNRGAVAIIAGLLGGEAHGSRQLVLDQMKKGLALQVLLCKLDGVNTMSQYCPEEGYIHR